VVRALFDTNIVIDYLNAVPEARRELDRFDRKAISLVTWMEVMVGAPTDAEPVTRAFLDGFEIVEVDEPVAEEAVRLRRAHRVKLPDAVIWASARVHGMILVTRNTKDFPADDPAVRTPYQLRRRGAH
jgi:hypothetical protein